MDQVKYAGFFRRWMAHVIDLFFMFIIGSVVQTVLGRNPFYVFLQNKSLAELQQLQSSTSSTIASLVSIAVALVYYLIFYVNYEGATPGKRLLAIKVVKDDGGKLTYPVVIVRYLGSLISTFLLTLGYLWAIVDKRKQTLHDKLAKTVVVRTGAKVNFFLVFFTFTVALVFLVSYFSLVMVVGLRLSKELSKKNSEMSIGKSYNFYISSMKPEAKKHYDKSMQLFKDIRAAQNDPQKVTKINDQNIIELKKAIDIEPKNPIIWYQLGNAYTWVSTSGTLEDGLTAFKKAEEIDPKNQIYINGVGDYLIRMRKYEEAILQFQKTFRITDKSGYANLSIAQAYAALGIKDSAKEHFEKAIKIFTEENTDGSYDQQLLQARKGIAALAK